MPLAETKVEGFVGTICWDHLDTRNAFSAALADEIIQALERFVEARIRVTVLRAKPGVQICGASSMTAPTTSRA